MPLAQSIRLLAVLIGSLLLVSCIDSEEEIWVNRDGSGKAKLTLTVPSSVVTIQGGEQGIRKLVASLLDRESSAQNVTTRFTTTGKRTRIETRFEFASVTRLRASLDRSSGNTALPDAVRHMVGTTSLEWQGLAVSGERKVDFGRAIPGIGLLAATGTKHTLQTRLHLPVRPSSHNATRTENGGKTLVWESTLADAMKSPLSQQITYRLPVGAILTGIALIAVLALAALRARSRRRRRASDRQE